ncbi:MAG TPA: hypothetical protein VJN18_25725 [Polyangiaceae bacterium]|nr:hypothetical protein [Polyangiaceae bacterium]
MTISRREIGVMVGLGASMLAGVVSGCSRGDSGGDGEERVGTLNLPLATYGSSGARYRLRDATFTITDPYGWNGYSGEGGAGSAQSSVSSEDAPDADTISLSLERGYYVVALQPGWRMEKSDDSGTEDVEATLLSSESQWLYVSPRSTSWAEFQFGIGGRELWLNGNVNIGVTVFEDPDEYYGDGGGAGGQPATGSAGAYW